MDKTLVARRTHCPRPGHLQRRCFTISALTAGLLLAAITSPPAARAQAPRVATVTPARDATAVPVTSTLVFEFDQPMDTSVEIFPSIPPFVVGNLVLEPSGQVPMMSCTWGDDERTLTCEPSDDLPPNTRITWTLNPAGALFPITSSAGTPLATVSGSFTTGEAGGGGGTAPKLVSSNPADEATGVPVTTTVTFVFDQAMKKNPAIGGFPPSVPGAIAWTGTGVQGAKFSYSWSGDGKTLTCDYAGDLPGNTEVGWVLNPANGVVKLESQDDEPLPNGLYAGSFTTGQGSGGGCDPDGLPDTWGGYSLSKSATYSQTSTADPVPQAEAPFNFGAFVRGPQAGPAVTGGSVTLPGNTTHPLTGTLGMFMFNDSPGTEAVLDALYPAGNYTLRFTQTGQPERVIAMSMPATAIPVPKVANYTEAQSIIAAQDFTLRWNAFTGAGASEYIVLTITDLQGHVVFNAPDPCVPRELPVSATSIVIPANTLPNNQTLRGMLAFGRTFYSSTNTVADMAGFGGQSRDTEFSLRTGNGGGAADPARFTGFRLLPNGNPEMDLTGTAGRTYTIQRAGSLSTSGWNAVGTVTMSGAGLAVFQDTSAGKIFPLFYRAVAN